MKKFLLILLAAFIFLGCHRDIALKRPNVQPADPQFLKSYFTQIKKYDGIDQREALLLAQSQLKFEGRDKEYHIDHPQFISHDEEHWLVEFPPVDKTFAEARRSSPILFIIDKKTGACRRYPH